MVFAQDFYMIPAENELHYISHAQMFVCMCFLIPLENFLFIYIDVFIHNLSLVSAFHCRLFNQTIPREESFINLHPLCYARYIYISKLPLCVHFPNFFIDLK